VETIARSLLSAPMAPQPLVRCIPSKPHGEARALSHWRSHRVEKTISLAARWLWKTTWLCWELVETSESHGGPPPPMARRRSIIRNIGVRPGSQITGSHKDQGGGEKLANGVRVSTVPTAQPARTPGTKLDSRQAHIN